MSGYIEALEAHNAMHNPAEKKPSKISDERLLGFMRAHGMSVGDAADG